MATERTILRLGNQDHGRMVSSEDFAEAEFDEPWKYERINGRLIVMAPSGADHNDTVEPWRDRLVVDKLAHPQVVQKVVSEPWIRQDGGNDRIGDLGIYFAPDHPVPKIPDRIPDLMFEIVSPGATSRNRDDIKKRVESHRLGIREYVIIDRLEQVVTVLTLAPEGYRERGLKLGDSYESSLLPGLSIPLSEVF
jgi:Uma2 family endonuclease